VTSILSAPALRDDERPNETTLDIRRCTIGCDVGPAATAWGTCRIAPATKRRQVARSRGRVQKRTEACSTACAAALRGRLRSRKRFHLWWRMRRGAPLECSGSDSAPIRRAGQWMWVAPGDGSRAQAPDLLPIACDEPADRQGVSPAGTPSAMEGIVAASPESLGKTCPAFGARRHLQSSGPSWRFTTTSTAVRRSGCLSFRATTDSPPSGRVGRRVEDGEGCFTTRRYR